MKELIMSFLHWVYTNQTSLLIPTAILHTYKNTLNSNTLTAASMKIYRNKSRQQNTRPIGSRQRAPDTYHNILWRAFP